MARIVVNNMHDTEPMEQPMLILMNWLIYTNLPLLSLTTLSTAVNSFQAYPRIMHF